MRAPNHNRGWVKLAMQLWDQTQFLPPLHSSTSSDEPTDASEKQSSIALIITNIGKFTSVIHRMSNPATSHAQNYIHNLKVSGQMIKDINREIQKIGAGDHWTLSICSTIQSHYGWSSKLNTMSIFFSPRLLIPPAPGKISKTFLMIWLQLNSSGSSLSLRKKKS